MSPQSQDDRDDIAAAIAHITRLGMRHASRDAAFAAADAVFDICGITDEGTKASCIASGQAYFMAMERAQ